MIMINTTFLVEPALIEEWTKWIHADYIPAMLEAGATSPLALRILSTEESEGVSFAVQGLWPDKKAAAEWNEGAQTRLLGEGFSRWGSRVLYFTTLMEEVTL